MTSARVKVSLPEVTVEIELSSDSDNQYPTSLMREAADKAQELLDQICDVDDEEKESE